LAPPSNARPPFNIPNPSKSFAIPLPPSPKAPVILLRAVTKLFNKSTTPLITSELARSSKNSFQAFFNYSVLDYNESRVF
jgi:hypothetical protein